MREKIFRWLRGLTLSRFGHSLATEQKQAELQGIEKRRTYMFDKTLEVLTSILNGDNQGLRKLIEVGVGTGGFAKRLRPAQSEAFVIGVDPEVLDGNPHTDALVRADGLALPFGDGADAVVSTFVLHLLVQPDGDPLAKVRRFVQETRRTGKRVLVMDILGSLWTVFFATFGTRTIERTSPKFTLHTFRMMLSCLTRKEYEELADELGLELTIWGPNRFFPKIAILHTPVSEETY